MPERHKHTLSQKKNRLSEFFFAFLRAKRSGLEDFFMKDFWNCSADETLKHFGTTAAGLSDSEVLRIRGEKGENALMEQQPPSIVKVFLSQFCDLLIVILIIAAIISMFSGNA